MRAATTAGSLGLASIGATNPAVRVVIAPLLLLPLLALGPLGLLQGLAWGGMLVGNLQTGADSALERTFGGDHPCELCTAIAEEREQDEDRRPDEQRWRIEAITAAPAPPVSAPPVIGRCANPAPQGAPPAWPPSPDSPPPIRC